MSSHSHPIPNQQYRIQAMAAPIEPDVKDAPGAAVDVVDLEDNELDVDHEYLALPAKKKFWRSSLFQMVLFGA